MPPALWGLASAGAFGVADFMGRFSADALGPARAWAGVAASSAVFLTVWAAIIGFPPPPSPAVAGLIAIYGAGVSVGTSLLYAGLARGPVALVAPIVGAYPLIVVGIAVALGARPSGLTWAAMAVTIAGVVTVARAAPEAPTERAPPGGLARTVAIALASGLAFGFAIAAGQEAGAAYGPFATLWAGRLVAAATVVAFLIAARARVTPPSAWAPFLALQGALDTAAYGALLLGGIGEGAAVAAVVASSFGVVTILLARIVLKEPVSALQWGGIALVFAGVASLTWLAG